MSAVLRRRKRVEPVKFLKPTLLQYAAALSPLLPLLAALARRRWSARADAWVIAWCLSIVLQDAAAFALGRRGVNNMWMTYVSWPIISATALGALAQWHPHASARTALRAAIPLVVVVSIIFTVTIDNAHTFSLVVAPFHSIVMLLAAMWTFVSLSLRSHSQIFREDWFWTVGGIILYAATATAIQPLAWYLIRERVDLLHAAFNVRAAVVLVSFAAITWGMLPWGTRRFSGGSSSPPSSRSSSSSAA